MSDVTSAPVAFDAFVATVRQGVAALADGGSLPPIVPGARIDLRAPPSEAGSARAGLPGEVAAQVAALNDSVSAKVSGLAAFVEQATSITRRSTSEQVASLATSTGAVRDEVAALRGAVERIEAALEGRTFEGASPDRFELVREVADEVRVVSAQLERHTATLEALRAKAADDAATASASSAVLADRLTDLGVQVAGVGELPALLRNESSAQAAALAALTASIDDGADRTDRRLDTIDARVYGALEEIREATARFDRISADIASRRDERAVGAASPAGDGAPAFAAVLAAIDDGVARIVAAVAGTLDERLGEAMSLPELLAVFNEAHEQAYNHAIETVSSELRALISQETREIALTVQSLTRRLGGPDAGEQ